MSYKINKTKQAVNLSKWVTGEPRVSFQEKKKSMCNLKTKQTYSLLSCIPFSLHSFCYLHTHTFLVSLGTKSFPSLSCSSQLSFVVFFFFSLSPVFSCEFFCRLSKKQLSMLICNAILAKECLFLTWFGLM